jgi:carbon monoxide dehydrogenase subunit G
MPTEITCQPVRRKEAGETVNVAVDFQDVLDKDSSINETISAITSVAATGLTITSPAVTSVSRKINGRNVDAGKAITFTVAGGTLNADYAIKCTVVTSGSQTRVRYATMEVRGA